MDPFKVGLFSDGQESRPVIRAVFAPASPEAGVLIPDRPEREHHYPDKFAAFDIWCAGLSQDTLKVIGDDLHSCQVLLQRSLKPHGAFNLKETHGQRLDDKTRAARGCHRRRMAPLTMRDMTQFTIDILKSVHNVSMCSFPAE
jgi:hypothetical protein